MELAAEFVREGYYRGVLVERGLVANGRAVVAHVAGQVTHLEALGHTDDVAIGRLTSCGPVHRVNAGRLAHRPCPVVQAGQTEDHELVAGADSIVHQAIVQHDLDWHSQIVEIRNTIGHQLGVRVDAGNALLEVALALSLLHDLEPTSGGRTLALVANRLTHVERAVALKRQVKGAPDAFLLRRRERRLDKLRLCSAHSRGRLCSIERRGVDHERAHALAVAIEHVHGELLVLHLAIPSALLRPHAHEALGELPQRRHTSHHFTSALRSCQTEVCRDAGRPEHGNR